MQLNSDYYDTDFKLTYKGSTLLIRNDGPQGESLFVNGELQDQNFSAHNGHLIGHIFDEENNREVIEVFLGGTDTSDCLIYANGSLIHTHVPPVEPMKTSEKEKMKEKRRRSNLFFPFLVILMMAMIMLLLLPALEEPETAPVNADGQDKEAAAKGDIEVKYDWNYGDWTWTYTLTIPKSAYEEYKTVDRQKIRDYSYYVTDPSDDEYLAGLTDKFKEAAEKEAYSDLDMVTNIIFFVQNLTYVDDKVGTGYDEYPKFPLETLADEGGDCEDSAILLASLLRELGYGTVLIQFPDHMGVGVKGETSIKGSYYEVDGIRYYYVETTSTGWDIGEIPDQMKEQPARILPLNY
ncbi:MAG: hypothetical protein PHC91_07140 [Eubacteriales bacterium]|nr:hypothetical protein [Eubacteriales bacterium]